MKKIITECVMILTVLFLFTGCLATIDLKDKMADIMELYDCAWSQESGTVYTNLHYDTGERNIFDVYIPKDISSKKSKHLIMFIHGGGWTSGDKSDNDVYCKYFTSLGYPTFSINYNYCPGWTNPILPTNQQALKALKAAKNFLEEKGLALEDTAVFGISAGAAQAMMLAYRSGNETALPVKFVAQQAAPCCIYPELWDSDRVHWIVRKMLGLNGTDKNWARFISNFTGKNISVDMVKTGADKPFYEEVSALNYVTDKSVPMLFIYGKLDGIVPAGTGHIVDEKFANLGISHDYLYAEHSGHGLVSDFELQKKFRDLFVEYCERYFLGTCSTK
ncbi:alpha/beta hydrolase [Treponema sp.]|uniref:alpha/beta hydrolase n=1 Tax=Treponema sp. TaxID=166 RepID=UPI003FD7DD02